MSAVLWYSCQTKCMWMQTITSTVLLLSSGHLRCGWMWMSEAAVCLVQVPECWQGEPFPQGVLKKMTLHLCSDEFHKHIYIPLNSDPPVWWQFTNNLTGCHAILLTSLRYLHTHTHIYLYLPTVSPHYFICLIFSIWQRHDRSSLTIILIIRHTMNKAAEKTDCTSS